MYFGSFKFVSRVCVTYKHLNTAVVGTNKQIYQSVKFIQTLMSTDEHIRLGN